MTNIWYVLPCGAMYKCREYNYADIAESITDYMFENIPKSELTKVIDPYTVGRKKKLWASRVYTKLMRRLLELAVDEMMQSNRVIITRKNGFKLLQIGTIPENPEKTAKSRKLNDPMWGAERIGVVLEGVEHNYYFRMPKRRRRELAEKIKQGQAFH